METSFIQRNCLPIAHTILQESPVLSITGLRQVGKTTLMRQLLDNYNTVFVNLDNDQMLQEALQDPDVFVERNPDGVLAIDEVQRAPVLLRSIKASLEKNRRPGRFVITGSSNILHLKGVEESLAGRMEILRLRGISQGESRGKVDDFAAFAWNITPELTRFSFNNYSRDDYVNLLFQTSFPGFRQRQPRSFHRAARSYLDLLLTKDAREISDIRYPDRLMPLVDYIAATGTGEFVASHIGRMADIPERSIPSYLQVLKSLFLVEAIPAWGKNLSKRALSRPKVCLADTALAAYLAGVNAEGLNNQISSALAGGLFESFVVLELLRQQTWSQIDYRLFHFRDEHGREVDVILENRAREIVGIEVKAATKVTINDFKGLKYLRDLSGNKFRAGIVLHTGHNALSFGDRLWALPMASLWEK